MNTHSDRIQARIEPELKASAEAVFARLGLSSAEAIRLFYKQVEFYQGLPFEIKIPNAETLAAFRELDQNKQLKRHKDLESFKKSLGL